MKIDGKKLGMNEIKKYVIENQRWDPITGAASAAIGTVYRSGMAIGDGFKGKGKQICHGDEYLSVSGASTPRSRSPSRSREPAKDDNDNSKLSLSSHNDDTDTRSIITTTSTESNPKKKKKKQNQDSNRIVRGFGKAGNTFLKGGLIDIPFALAEGLRNAPAMYGDKPRDFGPITDWKTGSIVAGKGLVFGLYDGISGLIMEPVKGAKKEGALGALKGFGKGIGGMYWKPNAGLAGVLGYTMQGIYKSVYSAIHTKTRKNVARARREEGVWLLARAREDQNTDLRLIVEAFEDLKLNF